MGAFVSNSGMSRELFRAANSFRRPFARRSRHRHHRGLRRLCGDLRLLGRDRSDFRHRRLSGNAALQLSAIVRHRRDRRRRHARRHVAAVDRARGLRHHHRAGHRQAVHRRNHSRDSRRLDGHADRRRDRPVAAGFPAGWRRGIPGRSGSSASARHLGHAAPVRLRDRRALWRPVHADRGRRGRRHRRADDRRRARPARRRANPPLVAAGGPHRRRGPHRADRRAAVRLFPHRHADAAESDRLPHRARARPLRRAGADHADVHRARLPDGLAGDDHSDHPDHLSGDHCSSASIRSGSASSSS